MHSKTQIIVTITIFFAGMIAGTILFSLYSNSKQEAIQNTSGSMLSETTNVFYENGGPFPNFPLACPADMPIRSGPTWRAITIGTSDLPAIEELYGVRFTLDIQPAWIAGDFAQAYSVLLTSEAADRWQLPGAAAVCVIDAKIMVLTISVKGDDPELPSGLIDEWIARYGVPDLVTWSDNNWRWRTVVWPQQGIAATVDVAALATDPRVALVNSVTFFPFAQGDDYLSEWPYTGLRRETPTANNEGYLSEENPFDFEVLLQGITEQP